ncbi:hypothetical protein L484_024594 [Morus notabilis]|uniref:EGF-like domain-containing protein n=1 Tax=Morus notabilis TaxID=981085 RepID=W9RTD8_9ROSA|nr:uncharacterized protein LOC21407328 [Morus notabilis]EXB93250.1 hypothetical protein L484_024594 [Morus notabilis]
MASSTSLAFLAMILVALPITAFGDHWDDIAPTAAEEICKDVDCGKGKCKAKWSLPLGFECECESGWKRNDQDGDGDDDQKFLPCVIPNCTLNYNGCQPAPPPVPEKEVPKNKSFFDPCYWAYCGEGNCVKNNTCNYNYKCECNSGFYNLLNNSIYPCYSTCTLGSDCSKLGIVANSSSDGDKNNQGTSFLPGKFHWMIIFMASFGLVLWK